jgi:hypothetical protein
MYPNLSPPQTLLLAMITISIEIHFTTLYMAGLGTRTEPLGEGAQAGKARLSNHSQPGQLNPLRRREYPN